LDNGDDQFHRSSNSKAGETSSVPFAGETLKVQRPCGRI
jgi:hypothetical protein